MKHGMLVWIVACAWACSGGADSSTPDAVSDASQEVITLGDASPPEDLVEPMDTATPMDTTPSVDLPAPWEDTAIPPDITVADAAVDTAEPVDAPVSVDTVDTVEPEPDPAADDDGDGLTNAEEQQIGTDPAKIDTDGDTYTDYDEVYEGTDPLDENNRIYIGYWPYNAQKNAIVDPGWDSPPANGTIIPQYQAVDQFGDTVDLYDFAAAGVPIVLDVATWFCEPCKALAHYFATGEKEQLETYGWWNSTYEPVKDYIDNGDLIWITVLYTKGVVPVGLEEVAAWDEAFPHEHVPVLADTNLQLQAYLDVGAMPHLDLLDENMVFLIYETKGPTTVMKELATW